jgi:hypothetical protein
VNTAIINNYQILSEPYDEAKLFHISHVLKQSTQNTPVNFTVRDFQAYTNVLYLESTQLERSIRHSVLQVKNGMESFLQGFTQKGSSDFKGTYIKVENYLPDQRVRQIADVTPTLWNTANNISSLTFNIKEKKGRAVSHPRRRTEFTDDSVMASHLFELFHPLDVYANSVRDLNRQQRMEIHTSGLLYSPPNGVNQQAHTDFDVAIDFDYSNNWFSQESSAVSAIYCYEESMFLFENRKKTKMEVVPVPANCLIIFPRNTIHGGAKYTQENYRYFAKLYPTGMTIDPDKFYWNYDYNIKSLQRNRS